uniref:GATA-type domain-containing protein n=1 Tax=Rhabditophanes sp. KR3021 TaxID=114890 RepID=A0AC35TWY7_9BILA
MMDQAHVTNKYGRLNSLQHHGGVLHLGKTTDSSVLASVQKSEKYFSFNAPVFSIYDMYASADKQIDEEHLTSDFFPEISLAVRNLQALDSIQQNSVVKNAFSKSVDQKYEPELKSVVYLNSICPNCSVDFKKKSGFLIISITNKFTMNHQNYCNPNTYQGGNVDINFSFPPMQPVNTGYNQTIFANNPVMSNQYFSDTYSNSDLTCAQSNYNINESRNIVNNSTNLHYYPTQNNIADKTEASTYPSFQNYPAYNNYYHNESAFGNSLSSAFGNSLSSTFGNSLSSTFGNSLSNFGQTNATNNESIDFTQSLNIEKLKYFKTLTNAQNEIKPICSHCQTDKTPQWRYLKGKKVCNACKQYYDSNDGCERPSFYFSKKPIKTRKSKKSKKSSDKPN